MNASTASRASLSLYCTGGLFMKYELTDRIGGGALEQFAPAAGEATEVLLEAIDEGGADRAGTVEALYGLERTDGIVGDYEIDENGDPTPGPISIFLADGSFELVDEIAPPADLVAAAAEGD